MTEEKQYIKQGLEKEIKKESIKSKVYTGIAILGFCSIVGWPVELDLNKKLRKNFPIINKYEVAQSILNGLNKKLIEQERGYSELKSSLYQNSKLEKYTKDLSLQNKEEALKIKEVIGGIKRDITNMEKDQTFENYKKAQRAEYMAALFSFTGISMPFFFGMMSNICIKRKKDLLKKLEKPSKS